MGKELKSSNVTSVSYNNKSKKLGVVFHGGGKPNRRYTYSDVSLKTYRRLASAKSPGKSVWNNLRRKDIEYKKL
jgi:hypothetical protein